MSQALIWAAGGTGFTFLMTTLGAAMVFLFRGEINMKIQRVFLGFAAGVMIAASVWSLLIPAINEAEKAGGIGWIPAAGGFVLGILFLLLMDQLLPHLHAGSSEPEGMTSSWKRTTLLVMAVTLHNIPEGMAVGLAFAMAAQNMGMEAGAAAADVYKRQHLPCILCCRQAQFSKGSGEDLSVMAVFIKNKRIHWTYPPENE